MLGARTALKDTGFRVDATESRQAYAGPALVRRKGADLPENVVVHLGTNGTFPLSTCKSIVRAAGPDRRVFLVNVFVPRSWQDSNNAVIRQCNEAFAPDRVHVIDWNAAASAHRGWFYGDRIHLKPAGGEAFARLLDDSVTDAVRDARSTALASASGSGTRRPRGLTATADRRLIVIGSPTDAPDGCRVALKPVDLVTRQRLHGPIGLPTVESGASCDASRRGCPCRDVTLDRTGATT